MWMPASTQQLNRGPASSPPPHNLNAWEFVTNHKQTISDFRHYPIHRAHENQIMTKAHVKNLLFLKVQVIAKVRQACNPSHYITLYSACWLNFCWTSIGRNCMMLFIFLLSDEASWRIHLVLLHLFEPKYLCYINIVALRLITSLWLNDAVFTRYNAQQLNVSD
jgi:hypothetical protein